MFTIAVQYKLITKKKEMGPSKVGQVMKVRLLQRDPIRRFHIGLGLSLPFFSKHSKYHLDVKKESLGLCENTFLLFVNRLVSDLLPQHTPR